MKLSKWCVFFLGLIVVVACKKENTEMLTLSASKTVLKTGDSLQLLVTNAGDAVQFSFAPNIGQISAQGIYRAPQTLYADSTLVTLKVQSGVQTATTTVTIIKSTATDTVISFNQTIMPLLVANCNFSGCHGNGSRAGRVELSSFDSVRKHVVVYQPEKSLLYTSMIKPDELRRMPPAGPLHAYKLTWVRNWIEQGARNN